MAETAKAVKEANPLQSNDRRYSPHLTRTYSTLSVTALGGIIYLALFMAIDKETRTSATFSLARNKNELF